MTKENKNPENQETKEMLNDVEHLSEMNSTSSQIPAILQVMMPVYFIKK